MTYGHLQADCLYTGISSGPNARYRVWEAFTFYLFIVIIIGGAAISRSQVQILLGATLRNNLKQVVYTYVPLSPSSITWYRPEGGDALRLGR